ncbi:MAG: hypothetical protein KAI66_09210 [Lentisphaeria bacterium]|nr:hypothetical protein [Lentisphaeria bacterium]
MDRPRIDEALEQLRNKSPRSTTLERLALTHEAWERHKGKPQPLQFAAIVEDLLSRIEVPVKPWDLVLGRIREDVPDTAGEARFQNFLKILPSAIAPSMTDSGHETLDWERLLQQGLGGLKAEAKRQLERRRRESEPQSVLDFLTGMTRVYGALQMYAMRYAKAARACGLQEQAAAAQAVSEREPQSFREAVQLIWFVGHVYCTMMARNPTLTFGRMDQWLFPFYERDLRNGILSREQAGDIIEDFYCKNNLILGRGEHQMSDGCEKATGWLRNLAYDAPQYVVLGGRSRDGMPDCTDLTNLFLECIVSRFENPCVVVRFWKEMPGSTWRRVCRKLRDNASMMVYNDECIVPAMQHIGFPLEEALEYTMHGCNWPDLPPSQTSMGCAWHNVAKLLLVVLPTLREATGMGEVYAAFRHAYRERIRADVASTEKRMRELTSDVPGTLAMDDCFLRGTVENARAKHNGGVRHRTMITTFGGFATLVDSLAAIEHVVFTEAIASMGELVDALESNFERRDVLRQHCLAAPKWGRDDERADTHAVRVMELMQEEIDDAAESAGVESVIVFRCIETDMGHIRHGSETGTTPDGRGNGQPLSENTSPTAGVCTQGVTAMLQSIAKLPLDRCHSGALNLRLQPAAFTGERGVELLDQLLHAYFEQGGMQIQLSMADSETLREAQCHPEKHQDLMVRITGYSAAFVDMGEAGQNEIIRREEMSV